jgi:hypothetical protein
MALADPTISSYVNTLPVNFEPGMTRILDTASAQLGKLSMSPLFDWKAAFEVIDKAAEVNGVGIVDAIKHVAKSLSFTRPFIELVITVYNLDEGSKNDIFNAVFEG